MRGFNKFLTILGAIFLVVIFFSVLGAIFGRSSSIPEKGIAILKIEGVIAKSDYYIKKLKELKKDKRVKAIVLRVDSPGGAVVPCQEIYNEVLKIKKEKPVIASMASIAASGGLYISVAATKVLAEPATITGSIGVIMQTMNFKKVADKIGVKVVTVKSAPHKDLLSPFKNVDEGDIKIIQAVIDDMYEQFLHDVSSARSIPVKKLKPIADGRVFTGRKAKDFGIVDEVGGLDRAVEIAKNLSKYPNAKPFEVKKKTSVFDKFLGGEESLLGHIFPIMKGRIEKKEFMYLY